MCHKDATRNLEYGFHHSYTHQDLTDLLTF